MMRLAVIILALAATAAGVVALRTRQIAARAQIHRLESERLAVRRRLWEQQLQLARTGSLTQAEARRERWALPMVGPGENGPQRVAQGR